MPNFRKILLILPFLLTVSWPLGGAAGLAATPPRPDPEPGAMIPDIFKEPLLSENPTQVEIGAYEYFYHCMPCHGDHGQGLTDEFREQWVPDHRNCWASGCHGGRVEDEGFPIPREVPDLLDLARYPTPEVLFHYLESTHPPQRPGVLEESQYWALTAYSLHLSGRLAVDGHVGPETPIIEREPASPERTSNLNRDPLTDQTRGSGTAPPARIAAWQAIIAVLGVMVLVSLVLIWQARNADMSFLEYHD